LNSLSADAIAQANPPFPLSSWSDGRDLPSSSVAGGYEDEIVLAVNDNYNFPLDDDLEWLLSAKSLPAYAAESRDVFLNQVNDTVTAAIPVSFSALPSRVSPGVSPDFMPVEVREPRKETGDQRITSPGLSIIVNPEKHHHHHDKGDDRGTPSPSIPTSASRKVTPDKKLSPTSGSPKSPKYYSWYEYHLPPRTASPKAAQSRRGSMNANEENPVKVKEQPLPIKEKKAKKEKQDEVHMLLSKSMPVFLPSSVGLGKGGNDLLSLDTSQQQSNSQESKRSVQGLTNMVFEGKEMNSPFVDHLLRPNKALIALKNPILANRPGMKGLNITAGTPPANAKRKSGKKDKSNLAPSLKTYAIIQDPFSSGIAFSNTGGLTTTASRFPAIPGSSTAKASNKKNTTGRFNSSTLLEAVYEKPDDLYVKSKKMMEQLQQTQLQQQGGIQSAFSSSRSKARITNKQGYSTMIYPYQQRSSSPLALGLEGSMAVNDSQPNFMNSHPTSPQLIRTLSPPTLNDDPNQPSSSFAAGFPANNIDDLIANMGGDKILSLQAQKKRNTMVHKQSVNSHFSASGTHPHSFSQQQPSDAEVIAEDALEMLESIHIDPLYRIIRDEIELVMKRQAEGSENDYLLSSTHHSTSQNQALLSSSQYGINVNNIKILSNFHSLPPSAWVICRIIYFLIMSYFETIIKKEEYLEYRKVSQLESIWKILERHYYEEHLNTATIFKMFSWPYLQELMISSGGNGGGGGGGPSLFVKLLEMIENGIQLNHIQWKVFNEGVRKILYDQQIELQHQLQQEINQVEQQDGLANHQGINSMLGTGGKDRQMPHHPSVPLAATFSTTSFENTIPLDSITDNEKSRNLFYDLFPICGLSPLRMMVNAGKAFLVGNHIQTPSSAAASRPSSNQFHLTGGTNPHASGVAPPVLSSAHLPGTPLAITISLTSWLKRIIALLYVSSSQRLKEIKGTNQPVVNEAILHEEEEEAAAIGRGHDSQHHHYSPYPVADGREGEDEDRRKSISSIHTETHSTIIPSINPKFFQTTHFSTRISSILILHHPSQSSSSSSSVSPKKSNRDQTAVLRGVPAYFFIATGLVKPSDELEVLIMKPLNPSDLQTMASIPSYDSEDIADDGLIISDPNERKKQLALKEFLEAKDDYYVMRKDIQKHLRITSASPLHTVQILPLEKHSQHPSTKPNKVSYQASQSPSAMIEQCYVLHDGLLYCLSQCHPFLFRHGFSSSAFPQQNHLANDSFLQLFAEEQHHLEQGKSPKVVDLLFTEFKIGKKNQSMIKTKKHINPPISVEMSIKAEEQLK
jgi:hypothetical protein